MHVDGREPVLILMSGLPGVGKSAVANELGRRLPAVVLSVDHIEDAMLRGGVTQSFETGVAAYQIGAELAAQQLALGQSVIADAANYLEIGREVWRQAARRTCSPVRVVHVECSDRAVHQRRLAQRQRNLSHYPEPTWADVDRRRSQVQPWPDDVLVVDSAEPFEATIERCLGYLLR